jgi:hypothetical protein
MSREKGKMKASMEVSGQAGNKEASEPDRQGCRHTEFYPTNEPSKAFSLPVGPRQRHSRLNAPAEPDRAWPAGASWWSARGGDGVRGGTYSSLRMPGARERIGRVN